MLSVESFNGVVSYVAWYKINLMSS